MKHLHLTLAIFCLIAFTGCTTIHKLNFSVDKKEHTIAAVKEDIDFVYNTLKQKHPGLYWYTSKVILDKKIDSLKNSITHPLKTHDLYLKLAPVVAAVNCGHTRLILVTKHYSKKEKDSINRLGIKPLSQFSFAVKDNRLYIRTNRSEDSTLKEGTEIIEIDSVSTKQIFANIKAAFASDGYNTTFKDAVLNRSFTFWYNSYYGEKDSVRLKYITANEQKNEVIKIKKPAQPIAKPKPLTKAEQEQKKRAAMEAKHLRYKGLDENKRPLLDLNFIGTDKSIAHLKVRSFSFRYNDFEKFFKESFAKIDSANAKNLIIDLRNNGGGSLSACNMLFSYLVDKDHLYLQPSESKGRFIAAKGSTFKTMCYPLIWFNNLFRIHKIADGKYYTNLSSTKVKYRQLNNFKGKVFIILNGASFSASTLLAANLVGINRATIVGQESGGGFNQFTDGKIPVVNLPHSKLKLRFGMNRIAPINQTEKFGRGVFPDIPVERTLADELQNKDPEVEAILKNTRKIKSQQKRYTFIFSIPYCFNTSAGTPSH